jgi:hypothetical protein
LLSCASKSPTNYYDNNDDFYGKKILYHSENKTSASVFRGNQYTEKPAAYCYSRIYALEHCFQNGKITLLQETIDLTKSHDEKTKIIHFFTPFKCVSYFKNLASPFESQIVDTKNIPFLKSVNNKYEKAIKINNIFGKSLLKINDYILSIDKNKVTSFEAFYQSYYYDQKTKNHINFTLIRNGKKIIVKESLIDLTLATKKQNINEKKLLCQMLKAQKISISFCTKQDYENWIENKSKNR